MSVRLRRPRTLLSPIVAAGLLIFMVWGYQATPERPAAPVQESVPQEDLSVGEVAEEVQAPVAVAETIEEVADAPVVDAQSVDANTGEPAVELDDGSSVTVSDIPGRHLVVEDADPNITTPQTLEWWNLDNATGNVLESGSFETQVTLLHFEEGETVPEVVVDPPAVVPPPGEPIPDMETEPLPEPEPAPDSTTTTVPGGDVIPEAELDLPTVRLDPRHIDHIDPQSTDSCPAGAACPAHGLLCPHIADPPFVAGSIYGPIIYGRSEFRCNDDVTYYLVVHLRKHIFATTDVVREQTWGGTVPPHVLVRRTATVACNPTSTSIHHSTGMLTSLISNTVFTHPVDHGSDISFFRPIECNPTPVK